MKVAKVALDICALLNKKIPTSIHLDLVQAGALVHDIARKEPDHAARGAGILRKMGFLAVADIVASHMDIVGNRLEAFSIIREKLSIILGKDIVDALQDLSFKTR